MAVFTRGREMRPGTRDAQAPSRDESPAITEAVKSPAIVRQLLSYCGHVARGEQEKPSRTLFSLLQCTAQNTMCQCVFTKQQS